MRNAILAVVFLSVWQLQSVRAQGIQWTGLVETGLVLRCTSGSTLLHHHLTPAWTVFGPSGTSTGFSSPHLNVSRSIAALRDAQGRLVGLEIHGSGWASDQLPVNVLDEGVVAFDFTSPVAALGAFTIEARQSAIMGPSNTAYRFALDAGAGPLHLDHFPYGYAAWNHFELPAAPGPAPSRVRIRFHMSFGIGVGASDTYRYELQVRFVPGITAVTQHGTTSCAAQLFQRDAAGWPTLIGPYSVPAFLVYGLQPLALPLPAPFHGCPLLTTPDVVVPQPAGQFAFLPPVLPSGFAVHVQTAYLGLNPSLPPNHVQLAGALRAVGQ